jgi:phosphatidylglycerophosphate synthase
VAWLTAHLPDRDAYLSRWAELHGGHDPRGGTAFERGWFAVVYALARPLAERRVPPDVVSVGSVVLAAAAAVAAFAAGPWAWVAGALVLASAVLDGVDGGVALLGGRATRWGYVLDSLADRVCEALFGVAVWAAGVPGWLCVLAVGVGWLHEYVRARATAAGLPGIGAVTVAERPTRVILAAAALIAAGLLSGWLAGAIPTALVAGWAVLALGGLTQLLLVVRGSLR